MPKESISKTAQVNLQMLTDLGVPEAVCFSDAIRLEGNPLAVFKHLPLARRLPLCISCISEVLYESANDLILRVDNPTILDIACGYSPRVLLMAPLGFTYIGADLPDVTADLMERLNDILPTDPERFAGYRTVDATNQEQMRQVLGALREPITVVTQGLLPYLTPDQKRSMAQSIRELLLRDGGCWIIPDTNSSTLVSDTVCAVLGGVAVGIVTRVNAIQDKLVKRDRTKMGWSDPHQITEELTELGFSVERVPLYRDGMELRCLERVGEDAAARLRACWQDKSSIVASV